MELTLPALAVLAVCALDLIVAGVVLSQAPRSPVNLSFALFAFSGVCWAFGTAFFLAVSGAFWLDFFARFLYAGGSAVTITFLYFALVFKRDAWLSLQRTLLVFAPLVLLVVLYFFTDYLIAGYAITANGVRGFSYGNLHYLFDITLWGYFITALYIYGGIYRSADRVKGRQALVIMLGTYVNVLLASATNIIGPSLFYYFQYIWVGPFAMIVWISSVAYAISRYQMFNIRVIAAEFLVFSLWTFFAVRIVISNSTQDFWVNSVSFLVTLILGFFLVLSVNKEIKSRERIQKQEEELEIVNAQQENLLHFISHEIKGYLTKSEAGFAAINDGTYGPISADLKSMTGLALSEMRKGVATVMDILDASNLKKGTVSYKKNQFDFKAAVLDVVQELKNSAEEKHLSIEVSIGEKGFMTEGDEEKLKEHAIRNLIDNAIKYTPDGGTIRVELARTDGHFRFSVKDSGVGVTPEDMKLLFTEGGHGKDSLKVNVHSTGYGLYIAKKIIEAHGGKIWAESEGQGKGSRFIIELPVAIA